MTEPEPIPALDSVPAAPGRRPLRTWALILLAILFAGGVVAAGGAYWLYTQPKPTAGVVRDGATHQPLAGVTVRAATAQAVTDTNGRYQLAGVGPADHVTAEYNGYFLAETAAAPVPADASQWVNALLAEWQALQAGRQIDFTLKPAIVQGVTRSALTHEPLAGVRVSAADVTVESDAAGAFTLLRLIKGAEVRASKAGYAEARVAYPGGETLDIALVPNALTVTVRDAYTSKPLAGADVAAGEVKAQSDAAGRCVLRAVTAAVQVQLRGYDPVKIPFTSQTEAVADLRPNTLAGVVRAAKDRQPVAGAWVGVGAVETTTAADGSYRLEGVPANATLMVRAKGYDRANVPITRTTTLDVTLQPFVVRGVYLPFGYAGKNSRTLELWRLIETTEINAIVVDVKDDSGYLNYPTQIPQALAVKAVVSNSSLDYVLAEARKRNLYVIARIVVFKDDLLARGRPEWAVMTKSGQPYLDFIQSRWVDPFRTEVWDYNIAVAKEVIQRGVDEVQFDYVRFPSDGPVLRDCVYSQENTEASRCAAIEGFLAKAYAELKPLGAYVAVDVFGLTGYYESDMGIGQHVVDMSKHLDYLCPMVYPSTFRGFTVAPGLERASEHPYEIVHWSLGYYQRRLKDVPNVQIRPWLQAFQDYAYNVPYTVKEMRVQRQASEDLGIQGWMYWNAACKYLPELFDSDPARSP